jgi:hypothetical protein
MGSALLGGMISGVPCADMELLALSADLISSYFVRGCMEDCMRGCIIRYFPLCRCANMELLMTQQMKFGTSLMATAG